VSDRPPARGWASTLFNFGVRAVSVGDAQQVINLEAKELKQEFIATLPEATPYDRDLLKRWLLRLGHGEERRKLLDRLSPHVFKSAPTPVVVIVVGEPGDLPTAFAERFAAEDLPRLNLRLRTLGLSDWPSAFDNLVIDVIRDLAPAFRPSAREDTARWLSQHISRSRTSLCLGHSVPADRLRAEGATLDRWLTFLLKRCVNPRRQLLLAFVCVERRAPETYGAEPANDTGAAPRERGWTRQDIDRWLADRSGGAVIVPLEPVSRQQLADWLPKFNASDLGSKAARLPADTVDQVFRTSDQMSHLEVCNRLESLLRQADVMLVANLGEKLAYAVA
jgi:hypothetical protein